MDRPTCETCAYFECNGGGGGKCHRRAIGSDLSWPFVGNMEWCGEHSSFWMYLLDYNEKLAAILKHDAGNADENGPEDGSSNKITGQDKVCGGSLAQPDSNLRDPDYHHDNG